MGGGGADRNSKDFVSSGVGDVGKFSRDAQEVRSTAVVRNTPAAQVHVQVRVQVLVQGLVSYRTEGAFEGLPACSFRRTQLPSDACISFARCSCQASLGQYLRHCSKVGTLSGS